MSLANTNGYYPPPSALHRPPFPGSLPPPPSNTNSYVNMPPPSSAPQPAQTQPSLASLPPNILALLQQSQAQPPALAVPQYGMPGQQMMTPATAAATPAANYNQLMAFLVSHCHNLTMYTYTLLISCDSKIKHQTTAQNKVCYKTVRSFVNMFISRLVSCYDYILVYPLFIIFASIITFRSFQTS